MVGRDGGLVGLAAEEGDVGVGVVVALFWWGVCVCVCVCVCENLCTWENMTEGDCACVFRMCVSVKISISICNYIP